MGKPIILDSVAALRAWRETERRAGRRVGLVPTMGALHAGHLSLVAGVKTRVDKAVISIFVNPTQFAPTEDFSKYPRTFENDVKLLSEVGAEAVFAPQAAEMYPAGFVTTVSLEGPAKVGLEDAFRPTHFAGVATVVSKLLLQALPDVAIFGEKDFQQLAVIRRMAIDLDIPVAIMGGATVREADGLAMSSRNVFLTPEERVVAPRVIRTMKEAKNMLLQRKPHSEVQSWGKTELSRLGFNVDYFAVRDAKTLENPDLVLKDRPLRILVAAKLGKTRLIDNIAVG